VAFAPDNRKQFINGMALDHVFYRELNVVSAQSPVTSASDHNPLLVSFRGFVPIPSKLTLSLLLIINLLIKNISRQFVLLNLRSA
jgi:hypothetical protein